MAKGRPGADSSVPVNTQIQGKNLIQPASEVFGSTPGFWGCYFTSSSTSGDVEYCHLRENKILRTNRVRILPIARQTKRVNGTVAQGSLDAEANVEDFIQTFGQDYLAAQGGTFFMFLDVEGAPSLSIAYYLGWAQTLASHSTQMTGGAVRVLPCVYATRGDVTTWQAIKTASDQGVSCNGAWIARWTHTGCSPLDNWDDALVQPQVKLPCKVLLWQYSDDCFGGSGFDCDQTNPAIDVDAELLRFLVLPPDMIGVV